jgi:hypothetical protein
LNRSETDSPATYSARVKGQLQELAAYARRTEIAQSLDKYPSCHQSYFFMKFTALVFLSTVAFAMAQGESSSVSEL